MKKLQSLKEKGLELTDKCNLGLRGLHLDIILQKNEFGNKKIAEKN